MRDFFSTTLRKLGHLTINTLWRMGMATHFLLIILRRSHLCLRRPHMTIREVYFAGVMSLLIILVPGLFVGMVLSLQGYSILAKFGSSDVLGSVVALALLREFGPVLAALLFASRAGSSMTAEIGLMKATEQLDAMSIMAVDPIARVIAPRFWAGVVSMPILAALFNVVGLFGAYLVGVIMIGLDSGTFWSQLQSNIDWHFDVVNGLIKSICFGIAITLISVFEGYTSTPTATGIAEATTRTVVISAFAILAMDFILTAFMF